MRRLTPEEAEAFRQDYLEKDKETQRYINVYIAGIALVAGWIIGPQSKPLLLMAVGNGGFNVYAILFIVVVNVMFICFLIYKSLFIHEIMQFVAVLSERESGFVYWESWRRSKFSLTGRSSRRFPLSIRNAYTIILAVLPTTVSVMVLYHVGRLLWTDEEDLTKILERLSTGGIKLLSGQGAVPSAQSLSSLFETARVWFCIVVLLHVVPSWFFWVNVYSARRQWKEIHASHGAEKLFQEPDLSTVNPTIVSVPPKKTLVQITSAALEGMGRAGLTQPKTGRSLAHDKSDPKSS